jgi:hypothetical protein
VSLKWADDRPKEWLGNAALFERLRGEAAAEQAKAEKAGDQESADYWAERAEASRRRRDAEQREMESRQVSRAAHARRHREGGKT